MKELKIDPELRDLLPSLTGEEYKQLEKNILEKGFDRNFPIMEWNGFIADGHNRYSICKKHNIEYVVGTLAYKTKDEVKQWMLDIQLGRRNLSPIQRIAIAEKYRSIYERQAKKNLSIGGRNGGMNISSKPSQNSSKALSKEDKIDVRAKLAKTAGVSSDTYSKGKKILDSNNEGLKSRVLSGEISINAAYKELRNKKTKLNKKINGEYNHEKSNKTPFDNLYSSKNVISDEVKQICHDLKTEKSKEYLDSIWNYKIDIIECMNIGFEKFYDGFVSILNDMEERVTKSELDECILNAKNNVQKMLEAIEKARNTTLKMED